MCGICGLAHADTARPVDPLLLERMTQVLRHRGPDGHGVHLAPGIGLGIRRLSIIDLETGDQPIASEDGAVTVVCNGEIYNFRELRHQLTSAGHRFRTGSDVEVIVHLYEEHGTACLQRLRGMFAFALWDSARHRLMLARDRLGIKPLVYAAAPDGVLFASELKSILQSGAVERRMDAGALRDILTFGFVLAPRTLFASIRQVLPGHYLLHQDGDLTTHPYWDARFPVDGDTSPGSSADEWADALRAKLEECVRLHLRSDVPVGAWLSAGIDSSAIAALMCRLTDEPVQTFTLAFEDPRFDEVTGRPILSDYPGYRLTSQRAVCTARDLDLLPQAVWHCEDPLALGVEIPRLVLSRLTARHVKVALTGEGSDEVFGGYPWFKPHKYVHPLTRLPLAWRGAVARLPALRRRWPRACRILEAPAEMNLARYRQTVSFTDVRPDAGLCTDDLRWALGREPEAHERLCLPQDFGRWHPFAQLQYLEMHVRLPNFITRSLDAASMACGLEVRVPFLDHELVELCARIPPALKMRGMQEKHVLRRAMRRDLPAEIVGRRKRGMAAPFSQWMRTLPAFAEELLSEAQLRAKGYFEPAVVRDMLEQHRAGRVDHGKHLLGVLGVQVWDDLLVRPPAPVGP